MKILIIEDNVTMKLGMQEILEMEGHELSCAERAEEGLLSLRDFHPDMVITDLKMEGMSGIEFSEKLLESSPEVPILMVTAFGTIEKAVEAMQKGVHDFIAKPFSPSLLRVKVKQIQKWIQMQKLNDCEKVLSREPLWINPEVSLGKSFCKGLLDHSKSKSQLLICGAFGTEKSRVALMLSQNMGGGEKPKVIDLKTLDEKSFIEGLEEDLLDVSKGLVLLNLDQLSNEGLMTFIKTYQEKHKRFAHKNIKLILTCESKAPHMEPLKKMLEEGAVFEIPSLKDREDVFEGIISEWLKLKKGPIELNLPQNWLKQFKAYEWPCNLLELKNLLDRLLFFQQNDKIDISVLPRNIIEAGMVSSDKTSLDMDFAVASLEKRYIVEALRQSANNSANAAKLLGIQPHVLYYKMEKYDLE